MTRPVDSVAAAMETAPVLDDSVLRTLADVIGSGGRVLVLTGAGISAESGIPTFRGNEGYWIVGSRNYHPMEMATRRAFSSMPEEVWRWYLFRRTVCRRARPNAGHEAVVRMERALGDRFHLVTQNVDGLHVRAGNSTGRTIEIHGNIDLMRCSDDCRADVFPIPDGIGDKNRDDSWTAADEALLRCYHCGARTRPHVLWFDEAYDERLYRSDTALAEADRANLLIIVGTTGTTTLPVLIADRACIRDEAIVDVNPEDNHFAAIARSVRRGHAVCGSAASVLPAMADAVISSLYS